MHAYCVLRAALPSVQSISAYALYTAAIVAYLVVRSFYSIIYIKFVMKCAVCVYVCTVLWNISMAWPQTRNLTHMRT